MWERLVCIIRSQKGRVNDALQCPVLEALRPEEGRQSDPVSLQGREGRRQVMKLRPSYDYFVWPVSPRKILIVLSPSCPEHMMLDAYAEARLKHFSQQVDTSQSRACFYSHDTHQAYQETSGQLSSTVVLYSRLFRTCRVSSPECSSRMFLLSFYPQMIGCSFIRSLMFLVLHRTQIAICCWKKAGGRSCMMGFREQAGI